MGLPDSVLRPGDDAARSGRRALCHRAEPGLRARRAHRRPRFGIIRARPAPGWSAMRGSAPTGASPFCATRSSLLPTTRTCWRSTAATASCVWETPMAPPDEHQPYGGTVAPLIVDDTGHRRRRRRRPRHSRFRRRLQARYRRSGLAALDGAAPGRARHRNLARQGTDHRRRFHLADGLLRSVDRYALLAHRQSVARRRRSRPSRGQPLHQLRPRARTPRPASSNGTISSRRTM